MACLGQNETAQSETAWAGLCPHYPENKREFANLFSKDSHRFVRLKARQICFDEAIEFNK